MAGAHAARGDRRPIACCSPAISPSCAPAISPSATGEANTLLTDQGIKVGNPSQCVKQNLVAKRVFKHQRRYRVSQTGLDQLRQLLGPVFQT